MADIGISSKDELYGLMQDTAKSAAKATAEKYEKRGAGGGDDPSTRAFAPEQTVHKITGEWEDEYGVSTIQYDIANNATLFGSLGQKVAKPIYNIFAGAYEGYQNIMSIGVPSAQKGLKDIQAEALLNQVDKEMEEREDLLEEVKSLPDYSEIDPAYDDTMTEGVDGTFRPDYSEIDPAYDDNDTIMEGGDVTGVPDYSEIDPASGYTPNEN